MRELSETFGNLSRELFAMLREHARTAGPGAPLSVAISSAADREGKSFVAEALALHAAALGRHRILLVDANCERPSLTRRYRGGGQPGIADFLATDPPTMPAILPTPAENLSVVGTGRTPNPLLLFREDAIRSFVGWAGEEYGVVLFDTGSFQTGAGNAVVENTDRALFVIDSGRTPRSDVQQAIASLSPEARRKVWGVILNKRRRYLPKFLARA